MVEFRGGGCAECEWRDGRDRSSECRHGDRLPQCLCVGGGDGLEQLGRVVQARCVEHGDVAALVREGGVGGEWVGGGVESGLGGCQRREEAGVLLPSLARALAAGDDDVAGEVVDFGRSAGRGSNGGVQLSFDRHVLGIDAKQVPRALERTHG